MRNQKPNHVLIKDGRDRSSRSLYFWMICVSNRINSWYLFWSKCSQLFQSTGYHWCTVCNAPTLYASVSELQMLVCIVQTVNCSGWYCSPHPLTLFNLDPARNATRNSIGFAIVRRPLLQTLCKCVQLYCSLLCSLFRSASLNVAQQTRIPLSTIVNIVQIFIRSETHLWSQDNQFISDPTSSALSWFKTCQKQTFLNSGAWLTCCRVKREAPLGNSNRARRTQSWLTVPC